MSGEILLRADEASSAAQDVRRGADTATEEFNTLKGRLDALADSFRGQTATAWDAKYEEWHSGAVQMMEGLNGLGEFLQAASDAITETDASLASNLG